jgi:hypothetical protein
MFLCSELDRALVLSGKKNRENYIIFPQIVNRATQQHSEGKMAIKRTFTGFLKVYGSNRENTHNNGVPEGKMVIKRTFIASAFPKVNDNNPVNTHNNSVPEGKNGHQANIHSIRMPEGI